MEVSPTDFAGRTVSPLDAFTNHIPRTRVSPFYMMGLAVVAFAMVLLPAIYILLILLACWLVLLHLTHDIWILSGSGSMLARLLLYFGPIVAGGILIFFMLKPLFAKRAQRIEPISLDPAKEPLLFAFVQRICEQVGAAMPSRVDVDCQINASASLRRGILSRDLVLTIGLPLAAGLNMREFAGVLAHEFGHFAQGAGMRLTYVIRSINFWFARVVFERDEWDAKLDRSARGSDWRISAVLHLARGCVWLTRKILWLLMQAGHAVSCFMLRQMEYDADSYHAKVAGSDAVTSTIKRLGALNVANQLATEHVRQSWASHRLPENLPLLIQHQAGSLSEDIHNKITENSASKKTHWFDTHPCDADRERAAKALATPGIFRLERPATELFADFAATSKAVTHHQYEKHFELEFTAENLVASDEMLSESTANSRANACIRKYFGEVNVSFVPLLTSAQFPPLMDRDGALAQWRNACGQTEQLRPAAEKASAEYTKLQQQLAQMMVVRELASANFKLEPKGVGLPPNSTSPGLQEEDARALIVKYNNGMAQEMENLKPFVTALRTRVLLAVQLTGSDTDFSDAARLQSPLAAVASVLPNLHQIGIRLQPFMALVRNRGNHPATAKVDAHLTRISGEWHKLVSDVQIAMRDIPYPFPHPHERLTLQEFARYEKQCQSDLELAYHDAHSHQDRLFTLHYRLLGQFLLLIEQMEKKLENPAQKTVPG